MRPTRGNSDFSSGHVKAEGVHHQPADEHVDDHAGADDVPAVEDVARNQGARAMASALDPVSGNAIQLTGRDWSAAARAEMWGCSIVDLAGTWRSVRRI